jgi:hypothetical protein
LRLFFFIQATTCSVIAIDLKKVFMNKKSINSITLILLTICIANFSSCSKGDSSPTPAPGPVDVCAGKTIVITATKAASAPCGTTGSISVTATGSTNFTYKLNSGGVYQSSGDFTNVAPGDYTVFVKDGAGCEKSTAVTVASSGAAGPLFIAVKNLVAGKCQSCHNNSLANGGMNFAVECNIVKSKDRIKVRAVDEGSMPQTGPLTQSEKDIISAWITGGGGYTN